MRSSAFGMMAGLLALAACAPVTEERTGTRLVSANSALAMPGADGPSIVGVVERRYTNALVQQVALATDASTPGQNTLEVRFLGLARAQGDDSLAPIRMTDAAIAAEMRAAFPGVAMTISPVFVQNAYGPFGFATGRGAGRDVCFYGWQQIGAEVSAPHVRQGAIETRLRLCADRGDERSLLAGMYAYTVRTPFGRNWSTGSPAPGLPPGVGVAGAEIRPVALAAPPAAAPSAAPRRPAAAPMALPQAPAVPPEPEIAAPPAPGPSIPGPVIPGPMIPGPAAPAPLAPLPPVVPGPPAAPLPSAPGLVAFTPTVIVPPPPVRVDVPYPSKGVAP
jgi:hypothetical protein